MATPTSKPRADKTKTSTSAKTPTKAKKSVTDQSRTDQLRTDAPASPGLGQTRVLGASTFRTPSSSTQTSRARCVQCGKEVRAVPFALNNMVCRSCDGADRSRRVAALLLPDKSAEVLVADVTTDAVPDDTSS